MTLNTQVTADHHAPPVTRILAEFVANFKSADLPAAVVNEAERSIVNWLGCAIGAAHHAAPQAATRVAQRLGSAPQASVLGTATRLSMADAALVNGISSHTFDFDDTHLKTIIHPTGPVVSAALALAEMLNASGRDLVDASILGIDVACRIGNAMYPDHYDRGWHITGSTGTVGAAAACARLLKLDAHNTQMALGIAASQPVGMREQFGSMTKPLHPGAAARAGLVAALMAQEGFTASPRALEAPRGMMQTISTKNDWTEITSELGLRFEISFNSYKPFACGIVVHPAIDACVQLREKLNIDSNTIESLNLKVHPLVLELCGKKEPQNGLQAKFSVYHGCAAGLIAGRAGEAEYADEFVNRADVLGLRNKVSADIDPNMPEDAVLATLQLANGQTHVLHVEHAIGSIHRPLTDAMLQAKFCQLAGDVLGDAAAENAFAMGRRVATLASVRELVSASVRSG